MLRGMRALTALDVDTWLAEKTKILITRTLQDLHGRANGSIRRAMARDQVKRNVVELCTVPTGQPGRPSRSLTFEQAKAILANAESSPLFAYIVISFLTGSQTEEMRKLAWDHTDLDSDPDAEPPVPPSIRVWHSVREHGDTKTKKSCRTPRAPTARCEGTACSPPAAGQPA